MCSRPVRITSTRILSCPPLLSLPQMRRRAPLRVAVVAENGCIYNKSSRTSSVMRRSSTIALAAAECSMLSSWAGSVRPISRPPRCSFWTRTGMCSSGWAVCPRLRLSLMRSSWHISLPMWPQRSVMKRCWWNRFTRERRVHRSPPTFTLGSTRSRWPDLIPMRSASRTFARCARRCIECSRRPRRRKSNRKRWLFSRLNSSVFTRNSNVWTFLPSWPRLVSC
mmetsp:Transcript_37227/g.93457  ORF Transcript_37227/g.93457 Transcript_37227/m.93457 type:complete len:223 (+) Transcript_37227:2778-3446(+)